MGRVPFEGMRDMPQMMSERPLLTLSLGSGAILMVLSAVALASSPQNWDLLIEAKGFARGNVRAMAGGGWADGDSIILNAEQYPNWAEWDFEVAEAGIYWLYSRFAAASSRPLQLSIDSFVVRQDALADVTGSWNSSSAKWFPVGVVSLRTGRHTLSIWRQSAIPHLSAFGLVRDTGSNLATGVLALPEEVWLEDDYRIQEWWILGIGHIEEFTIKDGAYHITNGQNTLNRPLYGTNDFAAVHAGDRPLVLFAPGPDVKSGVLAGQIVSGNQRRWLDEAARVDFAYDGAQVEWRITDPLLGDTSLTLTVVTLDDAEGYILRAQSAQPVRLSWWYGGLRGDYDSGFAAGYGPLPGGRSEADCAGNVISFVGPIAELDNPTVPSAHVFVGVSPHGQWQPVQTEDGLAATILVEVGPEAAYVVAAPDVQTVRAVLADADSVWARALQHYQQIASRLSTHTPYPILDAAIRTNNMSLDGSYYPPSFMHGTLRWGIETGVWYLGWRCWYGPIVAGDWEHVAGAAPYHCSFQRADGRLASSVPFGTEPGDMDAELGWFYLMQETFLDHMRQYYYWTGDHALMKELWPILKQVLAYQRREIGKDLDGLYTNAVNTWISDGHHYNGNACTQASAYAISHNGLAAQVATLAGDDPEFFAAQARLTRREMNQRLWIADRGYFAEYVDRDGVLHDAAEAPSIYHPVEFGAADQFQAYQMTRYVDERLWRFGDLILVNDWFPVIVTNGCPTFSETLNTTLAYYYAGRFEQAWRLLKTCCDSTARAAVPGSISCYAAEDGSQGVYVDFADTTSLLARTVVEGLFGLQPRVDQQRVEWQPRFPAAWDRARLSTRGFTVDFSRSDGVATYTLQTDQELEHVLILPAEFAQLISLRINGQSAQPETVEAVLRPCLKVVVPGTQRTVVEVEGEGKLPRLRYKPRICVGEDFRARGDGGEILELYDPQGIFEDTTVTGQQLRATVLKDDGHHTAFVRVKAELGTFWSPLDIECLPPIQITEARLAAIPGLNEIGLRVAIRNNTSRDIDSLAQIAFAGQTLAAPLKLRRGQTAPLKLPLSDASGVLPGHTTVKLDVADYQATAQTCLWAVFQALQERKGQFAGECKLLDFPRNDTLTEIFTRAYQVGHPPLLNCWTWYETDYINTDAMRERAKGGVLMTHVGVPFATSPEGNDGLYLSRWQPFERSANIPVGVHADKLYLLLVNHTHNSQTHLTQAEVVLQYADGVNQTIPLTGPTDIDGMLQHYSDMAPEWIGGKDQGWYGHGRAKGVHADVTDIEVDPTRELAAFELRCVTEETLIGLLGATAHQTR